jgi:hypothetical protein
MLLKSYTDNKMIFFGGQCLVQATVMCELLLLRDVPVFSTSGFIFCLVSQERKITASYVSLQKGNIHRCSKESTLQYCISAH